MINFLLGIRNKLLYLAFFTIVVASSAVSLTIAFQLCFYPEKTLNKAVKLYHSLPAQYGGKIEPVHVFFLGGILAALALIELTVLYWVRLKTQSKNVINYKNPKVSINVKQLEKSIKESLTILTGINKSSVRIKHRKSGYVIKVYSKIFVDEGVHIIQLEKSINHLIRKRVREILLGISVDVKTITKIFIIPDKNYVSYNVIAEQNAHTNNQNFLNTNFPDNFDPNKKNIR